MAILGVWTWSAEGPILGPDWDPGRDPLRDHMALFRPRFCPFWVPFDHLPEMANLGSQTPKNGTYPILGSKGISVKNHPFRQNGSSGVSEPDRVLIRF